MSYSAVVTGLIERFRNGVPGLAQVDGAGNLVNILSYEPTSIQTTPTLYLLLDSFTRTQSGQVTAMRYRILARLCVKWQDNPTAETELIPFVNSIAAAVDVDPYLGGRVASGGTSVSDGQGTFVNIGGVLYRSLDTFVEVVDKAPWESGI